ncbi:MAG: hypothetical protein A2X11_12355 [Bacteroidetes bacterium GWE2_42_24]|nr:MAG: hypothetical protein A2X11_12355 [Bacteroidetes bacterium GWE2_42_24]OFY30570.1 MAG: hypothetical protein A2X09_03600 [Bacteroidetes bacterium GWF2_43_11]PKP27575.1 MAG: HAD family hydrolase [Bacteroidetes bacterium HGW-Bacteroidetes-22]
MIMRMKPGAIIFDFGGTIDTNGVHWSEKFWDSYIYTNVPVTKTDYEEAYVSAGDKMLRGIVKPTFSFKQTIEVQIDLQLNWLVSKEIIDAESVDQYLTSILNYCYEDVIRTTSFLRPLLEKLHEHYPIALVSNFYGNIGNVLKEFQIDHCFDRVIDSAVVGIRKPDPDIFLMGVNLLGVHPSDTLVIGDSYDRDIEPASKAGCKTAWLKGRSWRMQPEGELADITINNLQELSLILEF